jgi:hypothetical protein
VTNRLRMAQESGENIDIAQLVGAMNDLADRWA